MEAELADAGSCAPLLGALLLQSPKGGPVAEAAEGLCAADLESEWPFGTEDELEEIAALSRTWSQFNREENPPLTMGQEEAEELKKN